MKEQTTAKIYAASFLDLAETENINLAEEFTNFSLVINDSNDLENVLFLEVFTDEEKLTVFTDIAKKISLSPMVIKMISYLINEKRIGLFPLIFKEVIVIDDDRRGFLKGTISGSVDSISDSDKELLITEVKKHLNKNVELNYIKSDKVSAGYRVTIEDLQLDATIDNQLNQFKEEVLKN